MYAHIRFQIQHQNVAITLVYENGEKLQLQTQNHHPSNPQKYKIKIYLLLILSFGPFSLKTNANFKISVCVCVCVHLLNSLFIRVECVLGNENELLFVVKSTIKIKKPIYLKLILLCFIFQIHRKKYQTFFNSSVNMQMF